MAEEKNILHILWTNSELHTSELMVLNYATNAMLQKLWDEIIVIIWGNTAKLLAENAHLQEQMKAAMHAGVKFSACVDCVRKLGVEKVFKSQNIEIKPWEEKLTELIKEQKPLLTI